MGEHDKIIRRHFFRVAKSSYGMISKDLKEDPVKVRVVLDTTFTDLFGPASPERIRLALKDWYLVCGFKVNKFGVIN